MWGRLQVEGAPCARYMAAAGDYQGCIPADHKQKTAHPGGKGLPLPCGPASPPAGEKPPRPGAMFGCLPARRKFAFRGTVDRRLAMQERARYSVRHFGLLALAGIATLAAPAACQQGPFTDDEMDHLRKFAL